MKMLTFVAFLLCIVIQGVVSQSISGATPITNVGNTWSPSTVTISLGSSVNWTWSGGEVDHNVAQSENSTATTYDGSGFRSGSPIVSGQFSTSFSTAGVFYFICEVHAVIGMKGSITVVESSTTSEATTGNRDGVTTGGGFQLTTGNSNQPTTGSSDKATTSPLFTTTGKPNTNETTTRGDNTNNETTTGGDNTNQITTGGDNTNQITTGNAATGGDTTTNSITGDNSSSGALTGSSSSGGGTVATTAQEAMNGAFSVAFSFVLISVTLFVCM